MHSEANSSPGLLNPNKIKIDVSTPKHVQKNITLRQYNPPVLVMCTKFVNNVLQIEGL